MLCHMLVQIQPGVPNKGATIWDGLCACTAEGGDRYPIAPPNYLTIPICIVIILNNNMRTKFCPHCGSENIHRVDEPDGSHYHECEDCCETWSHYEPKVVPMGLPSWHEE